MSQTTAQAGTLRVIECTNGSYYNFSSRLPCQISDTAGMPTREEKEAFAHRLQQALKRTPKRVETAAELALNFNLRHPSDPITPQAAQKWLTGQALPTIDKIATLAEWLGVSLQWLGLGTTAEQAAGTAPNRVHESKDIPFAPPSEQEVLLLRRIRAMPEYRRKLVIEIVDQFCADHEIW